MALDMGNDAVLRRAAAADHGALRAVCLATGDGGRDATAREDDPDLLGQIYAVPYQVFAPNLAHVLVADGQVRGYLFGVPDTAAFETWLHDTWFAALRPGLRDPGPDPATWQGSDWARHHIHHPPRLVHPELAAWPAHGHIDLMPDVQRQGHGRRMMRVLLAGLRNAGAPGVHLELDPANAGARAFYAGLGFRPHAVASAGPDSLFMVMSLKDPA